MDYSQINIETERLRLVPISSMYREDIFREFTEAVARYTFPQPTGDITDVDKFIAEANTTSKTGDNVQLVAVTKESGEFIGCAGLHHLLTRPEPGLWLKESAWGKGLGLEIVSALKHWADEHLEYEFLYYPVHRENEASRRIPEKLGGTLEAGEIHETNARGEPAILVVYHIHR
jgi:RimJ/RimL family protein N-acetyltransferase